MPTARVVLRDSLILFLLAGGLIYKLFAIEYLQNWGSIESTFIADSRMLAEQLPHPGWQPLWYCGTRFDYVYPPALRYGPALISKIAGVSTARGYHLYTALLYAFGIAAVYWLVLAGAGSTWMARICAAGTALLSPAFVLLPRFRLDSLYWIPQRLHVLVAYGEGPHISSLSMLGAALAASIMAFRSRRLVWIALAGLACALVVSNNFYGATALTIFFSAALWAAWVTSRDNQVLWKAAAIVALAWGFCAFWLTPAYLSITLTNLKWVADPARTSSRILAIVFVAALAAITWHFGNRRPERSWSLFVYSSAALLLFYVVGFFYFGIAVTGVPGRLVPELDLALILALANLAFCCWSQKSWSQKSWSHKKLRFVPMLFGLLAIYPTAVYLRHLNWPFQKARHIENQYEYQVSAWVHQNLPGQRTLPSGSLRFWYDAWSDNAQADGGSMQGMENQNLMDATWQIVGGISGERATQWLQALGTDAVVVPDKTALDQYHDYPKPDKFEGSLLQLFNNGHGTRIYRVPRRFPGLARVVETSQEATLVPIHGGDDSVGLKRYLDVIEAGPDAPTTMTWNGFDAYNVEASFATGQQLLVQETYDPSWQARVDGQTLRTHPDVMGFTLIDVPVGRHTVEMRFTTPMENRVGYAAFFITCMAFVWLCVRRVSDVKERTPSV